MTATNELAAIHHHLHPATGAGLMRVMSHPLQFSREFYMRAAGVPPDLIGDPRA